MLLLWILKARWLTEHKAFPSSQSKYDFYFDNTPYPPPPKKEQNIKYVVSDEVRISHVVIACGIGVYTSAKVVKKTRCPKINVLHPESSTTEVAF